MEKSPNNLSAGAKKVQEYVARIEAGESEEEILKDLPDFFVSSIENGLDENQAEAGSVENTQEVSIPPQYEGMSAEAVEFIWTIPEYLDPEKTESEKKRKEAVLTMIRKNEIEKRETEEGIMSDAERIDDIREELKAETQVEVQKKDDFESFSVAHGETDLGMFWYQFRNKIAKDMKESGELEWGKERIYFDIRIEDAEKMKNLAIKIASENKIPIAFKYLDAKNTFQSHMDGTETRFVANFASTEDAKRFYDYLKGSPDYAQLSSDRNLDVGGLKLDGIAEYASGFREGRSALERIMNAKKIGNDMYEYFTESGKAIHIGKKEFDDFKLKYDKINEEMEKIRIKWGIEK